MAINGSISLTSSKAWSGSIEWTIDNYTLTMKLYMWKTDNTNSPSSGGSWSNGSVTFNGSEVIYFSYDQLEYGKTQYGDTYTTPIDYGTSYSVSASVAGLGGTSLSGYTLSGTGTIKVNQYNLVINTDSGASVSVQRISSNLGSTGTLLNGSYLYDEDVLQISFAPRTGSDLVSYSVNGVAFTSGETHTVSGAVAIAATSDPHAYILSINAGTEYGVIVDRTSSSKTDASTGELVNGSTIYHNDKLKISFTAGSEYMLMVNGVSFASGNTHTVTKNVSVSIAVDSAFVYIETETLHLTGTVVNVVSALNAWDSPVQGGTKLTSYTLGTALNIYKLSHGTTTSGASIIAGLTDNGWVNMAYVQLDSTECTVNTDNVRVYAAAGGDNGGISTAAFTSVATGTNSFGSYSTSTAVSVLHTTYYKATSMKFTTPSFSGQSSSIKFNLANIGTTYENIKIRWALCTSDDNKANYLNTSSAVSDTNQIASGTFTPPASISDSYELTVATTAINPNTTYYLFLWAGTDAMFAIDSVAAASHSFTVNCAAQILATLNDRTVVSTNNLALSGTEVWAYLEDYSGYVHIEHLVNSSDFEAYQCYIDNGTDWDLYVPYIDNGTSWDVCS